MALDSPVTVPDSSVRRLRLYYALLTLLQQQRGGIRHSRSRGEYIYNANIVTATIIIAGYVIYLAGDLAINGVNAPHYQVTCYSEGRRIYSGELQRMGENSDVWESDGNRVVLPGDCIYFQIDK
jgi:hypothetical protein